MSVIAPALAISGLPEVPSRRLPVPWRDPHTVNKQELKSYIELLKLAALQHPDNADIRTCLGMAHAMNLDVYASIDALEEARRIEPSNFFAQLKYGELWYRLRALERAEPETAKAIELAANAWELGLARKQIAEIRRLKREGTQKPVWSKSLVAPLLLMLLVLGASAAALLLK
jgi:hypothetical protein